MKELRLSIENYASITNGDNDYVSIAKNLENVDAILLDVIMVSFNWNDAKENLNEEIKLTSEQINKLINHICRHVYPKLYSLSIECLLHTLVDEINDIYEENEDIEAVNNYVDKEIYEDYMINSLIDRSLND